MVPGAMEPAEILPESLQVENYTQGSLHKEKEKGKIKTSKQCELICITPYLQAPALLQSHITAMSKSRTCFYSHLSTFENRSVLSDHPPCVGPTPDPHNISIIKSQPRPVWQGEVKPIPAPGGL